MPLQIRRSSCVVIAFLLLAGRGDAQYRRQPTIDDGLDVVQASDVQISPDGGRVLFSRSDLKVWKDNTRVSTIWMAPTSGSHETFQFLGSDKDRSPRWSVDGAEIAFLSTRDQKDGDPNAGAQIWIIPAAGGEAWKLTDHRGGVRSFEWARDGSAVFFAAEDAKSDDERAAEKAGEDAVLVDEGANGQKRGSYSNLWTVTLADRKERRITKDRFVLGAFKPSPDGRRVVISYRPDNTRNGQFKGEIAIVDVASGDKRDLTNNETPETDPSWSPDGQSILFQAPHDTSWELAEAKLWIVAAGGGAPRMISGAYQGSIARATFTPDGARIVFGGMQRGRAGIFELDIASGTVRAIVNGDRMVSADSVTRDLRFAAGLTSTPLSPPEVVLTNLASGETRKLTDLNPQIAGVQLAQFKSIAWKSKDGLSIEGHLWLPPDYKPGARLPLLVSIHGGPAGVWTTAFRAINHVYASLGWAVLEPNVRGSSSYGDALLRANMKDIGGGDYQDVISGVDKLIVDGIADPDQLAIRGWSYGGILGGWTLTQTQRFKAASLGAMVTDWSSEYAMGFNHDVRRWYIGGTPWDNPEGYRRQSSYSYVSKVSTPTILFHGEQDTTDTIGQSMMFYQALEDRNVPVRFIRFPREPHGFREPHHQRTRDAEEISWLMKYTRGIDWKAPERVDDTDRVKRSMTSARRTFRS